MSTSFETQGAQLSVASDCRTLLRFVYDPEGKCNNPTAFENDLTKKHVSPARDSCEAGREEEANLERAVWAPDFCADVVCGLRAAGGAG
jgi:hypothetical protein